MDNRLTPRDMHRFKYYNEILRLCHDGYNATQLSRIIKGSNPVSLMHYCRTLESEGYMTVSVKAAGSYNTPAKYYKTVIAEYDISKLEPIAVKIQRGIAENGGVRKESKEYKARVRIYPEDPPNTTTYRAEDREDLYRQQARMDRKKSYIPCNISSSMGMI